MATEKKINNLVINKVESQAVYDYMAANNLINEDELYLVEGTEGSSIVIDSELSTTSGNPVQNKVITTEIEGIKELVGDTSVSTQINEAVSSKAEASDLTAHTGNTSNPHSVTKTQVGLGNVPNVATNDQTPTYSDTTTFATLTSGEKLSVAFAKIKSAITNLINHIANVSNPHSVTKAQVGLGNVENKSSATIRGELTKENVTDALGYTPPTTNTTYGVATSSALGLVKSGTDITVDSNGNVSVNDNSHAHIISNIDGLQEALDSKGSASDVSNLKTLVGDTSVSSQITTAISTNADAKGSANAALTDAKSYTDTKISDLINGAPTTLDTLGEIATAMEENADVVAALEAAIGNKSDTGHTHNYAGSSSVGGAATSANKLNTNAGSATQPVYFENGVPVKTTYTLGASVPSGAKFTDTTYSVATTSADGLMSAADKTTLNHLSTYVGDSSVADQISEAIANKSDSDHTHTIATTSVDGMMSSTDKTKLDGIAEGAEVNVQSNWTETDTSSDAYILNKPSIKTGTGEYAVAVNSANFASGRCAFAQGNNTRAEGSCAFSSGNSTFATGDCSHAEGYLSQASGGYSHAEGASTLASSNYQHVQGKNNIEDANSVYAHIVGNGTADDARSNAHTLDWSGNAWFAGDIRVGGSSYSDSNAKVIATQEYVDNNKPTVDDTLSSTSTNAVQNRVVNTAISNLNTLVGDTAVSLQISNAIAGKSDVGHTHNYAGANEPGGAANKLNSAYDLSDLGTYPILLAKPFPDDDGTVHKAGNETYATCGLYHSTGTTTNEGTSMLVLGNSIVSGSNNNETGKIMLYNAKGKQFTILPLNGIDVGQAYYLPSESGTLITKQQTYTRAEVEELIATAKASVMPKSGGDFTGDVNFSVGGKKVWIAFEDENGNATTEPYIHWEE